MESATLTPPREGAGISARLRAVPASRWALLGLLALCLAALAGFLVYPTFPNYDSEYSLLWARELLHGHAPSFDGYRTPTEHPLSILFCIPLVLLGTSGDRVLVGFAVVSFVLLAAGMYRFGRLCFTPLVGAVAAILVCTRFDYPFLAARGYIDIPYLAIVVWAAALEVERPRRGTPVFLLLVAASLMRPEAWILAGLYWLWCSWRAPWRDRLRYAALAAVGPLVWAGLDGLVTGDALFSLHHTGETAEQLGRAKGLSAVPSATKGFLVQLDKGPVVLAAIIGTGIALWFTPRRLVMPVVLFLSGVGTFFAVGLAGLSIIQRYLLVPSLMIMVLAGVTVGGWTMLRRGHRLRTPWALLAALGVLGAIAYTALRVDLSKIDAELQFRGDSHRALSALLDRPQVRAASRCGGVSVPTHKLVPEVRWLLGSRAGDISAREQRGHGAPARGLAIVVTGPQALTRQVFTDGTVDPLVNVPPAGYRRLVAGTPYSAYARC